MNTEVLLAIVGIFASMATAFVYAAKKWADAKEKRHNHEIKMEEMRIQHEQQLETKRDERENARMNRDLETTKYIASNTAALQGVSETLKELHRSMGNGFMGDLRNHIRRCDEDSRLLKEIHEVVTKGN